ncbi:hypothetical protein K492DRAFT_203535 [Lichtheimia hyalospora FSU 10163]|nr:hypothetical protein K492DRAFT_203535 [Lichtheimia hyalospora FSU 10163]
MSQMNQQTLSSERFLSYRRIGNDFFQQWDALRAGARLAYESNRTLMVPPLHLSNENDPESQRWIQIPWSMIYDLQSVKDEYGILIIDEHNESIPPAQLIQMQNKSPETWSNRLSQWLFQTSSSQQASSSNHDDDDDMVTTTGLPPLHVPHLQDFVALKNMAHMRFGQGMSFQVYRREFLSERQRELDHALHTHLLLRPDGVQPIILAANQIIHALGGSPHYDGLNIRFAEYNNVTISDDDEEENDEQGDDDMKLLQSDNETSLDDDVILELLSGLPINLAVSAALPVQESTRLAAVMNQPAPSKEALLSACIDYRRNTDNRFPVFYLVTDMDPDEQPDLFLPFYRLFPCTFTKYDLRHHLSVDIPSLMNSYISARGDATTKDDILALLQPIVDIIVGGRGYSYLELPSSGNSNIVGLLQKIRHQK